MFLSCLVSHSTFNFLLTFCWHSDKYSSRESSLKQMLEFHLIWKFSTSKFSHYNSHHTLSFLAWDANRKEPMGDDRKRQTTPHFLILFKRYANKKKVFLSLAIWTVPWLLIRTKNIYIVTGSTSPFNWEKKGPFMSRAHTGR